MSAHQNYDYFFFNPPALWSLAHFISIAIPPSQVRDKPSWAKGFFRQALNSIALRKQPFHAAPNLMVERAISIIRDMRKAKSQSRHIKHIKFGNLPSYIRTRNNREVRGEETEEPDTSIPRADGDNIQFWQHLEDEKDSDGEESIPAENASSSSEQTSLLAPTQILSQSSPQSLNFYQPNYSNRFPFFKNPFRFSDGDTLESVILRCPCLSADLYINWGLIDLSNENLCRSLNLEQHRELLNHAKSIPKRPILTSGTFHPYPAEAFLHNNIQKHILFFRFIEMMFESPDIMGRAISFNNCNGCSSVQTYEFVDIYLERTLLYVEHQLATKPNPQHIFSVVHQQNRMPPDSQFFAIITSIASMTIYSFTRASPQFLLISTIWKPVNQESIVEVLEQLNGIKESLHNTIQNLKSKSTSIPAVIREGPALCQHFQQEGDDMREE